jgi:hypothetical protein
MMRISRQLRVLRVTTRKCLRKMRAKPGEAMKKIITQSILLLAILSVAACSSTPVRRSFKESWNDTMTAEKIRYKLMKDKEVKKSRTHVEVFRGQVTLTGRAMSDTEKARAEQLVKSVKRVTAVENYIRVVGDGKTAPVVAKAGKPEVIEEKTIIIEKEKIKISEDDIPAVTTARVGTGSGQTAAAVATPVRKSVEPKVASKTAKPAVKDTKLASVKKAPTAPIQKVTTVKDSAVAAVKEAPVVRAAPLPKEAAVPMSTPPATKVVGKSKTGLPWDGEVYEDDASSVKSAATASRIPEKSASVATTAKPAAPQAIAPQPAPVSAPLPKSDDLAAEAAQELEKLRQKR